MPDPIDRLKQVLSDRYAVERELGQGGMATVYLAQDLKHERQVAVKVVHPELAAILGATRFLNEIKVTAHLQHPYILPLHDSGEAGGFLYYVMPFVKGESLRDRLTRQKQLPVEDAVAIAIAVATGLDYAHRHGVVHRDIKPENILLEEGQPVIADFGIALAVRSAGGNRLTETGLSLGTPQYMSPEQAAGDRELDGRSDIYSLACVLYEMLAGEPPHTGPTVQAIMAKVLADPPQDVRELRHTTPIHVQAALERALAKLPADRYQSAREFAIALKQGAPATTSDSHRAAARRLIPPPTHRALLVGLGVVAGLAVGLGLPYLRARARTGENRAPVRFVIDLPDDAAIEPGELSPVAVSPDGQRIAYVGGAGRGRQLYVRPLSALKPIAVAGTEGARGPFFSPDGAWLGFFEAGKLKKVSLAGGNPVTLADAALARGADWGRNNRIVFTAAPGTGLWSVPADGGSPQVLTRLDTARDERTHRFPQILGDGGSVLFVSRTGSEASFDAAQIERVSIDRGTRTVVLAGSQGRLLPTGDLLFAQGGKLYAVAIDPKTFRAVGQPVAVIDSVMTDPATGAAAYAVSANGVLAYVRGGPWAPERRLLSIGVHSDTEPVLRERRPFQSPRYSPSGRTVAVVVQAANDDIFLYDLRDGTSRRVTFESGSNVAPVWSPDGSRIAFASNTRGRYNLYILQLTGTGSVSRLTTSDQIQFPTSWSTDGSAIAFTQIGLGTAADVWTVPAGGGPPHPFLVTPFNEFGGVFSPDGKWMAYVSDETGRDEVYVQQYPGGGGKRQVSSDGGDNPIWPRTGGRLFYRHDHDILAVSVTTTPTFHAGTPHVFVSAPQAAGGSVLAVPNYDVEPGNGAVVVVNEGAVHQPTRIHVVLNWFGELTQDIAKGQVGK